MCCASRCFCPCRSEPFASPTARDFVNAAVQIATARHAPVKRVQTTPAGRHCPDSAARSGREANPKRLRVFRRAGRLKRAGCGPRQETGGTRKELHHAESEKAPLIAPHCQSPRPRLFDGYGCLRVPQLPRKEAASPCMPQVRRLQGPCRSGREGSSQVS
jgi:hypothetical protein